MAVNEGLQPVTNDQVPVDPNVRIPDHVRRAAEQAEAYYKVPPEDPAVAAAAAETARIAEAARVAEAEAAARAADPANSEAQAAAEAERTRLANEAAQHPAPKPEDQNVTADEWRHRFLSMQGRYNKASQTIGAMEQQMSELGQELIRTQNMLQQASQQPPAAHHVPSQSSNNNLITEEDRANYGDELIDLARRAAMTTVAPQLDELRAENQRLTGQVKNNSRRELFMTLDQKLPQWRTINNDVRFKTWLRLPNVYTGQIRKGMLDAAVDGANAPTVLQFFKDFLTEATATGQMAPAQPNEQPLAPRTPAVNLETLAAPGRARPASGDSQVPSEKPVYSRADITRFYSDVRKGLYAGRDAEYRATEADLTAAQRDGRIRG